jgi:hypothetical protein
VACGIVGLLDDFGGLGCGTVVALLDDDPHRGVRNLDERNIER